MRELRVGDIVKSTVEILGNPKGSEGVVYEIYEIGQVKGVSIIFENGEYDGFSQEEQAQMLERAGHEFMLSEYKFTNVMKLSEDFDKGKFDVVFG